MPETKFTYQENEYEKGKSFYVEFYPISKKKSDNIDSNGKRLPPESIHHLSCGLYVNDLLVAMSNSEVIDHEDGASITLDVPNSCVIESKNAKAILSVTKFKFLDNIDLDVLVGDEPDICVIRTASPEIVHGVRVESANVKYYVSGKKTKKIERIQLSCLATNSSNERKLLYLRVFAKLKDENKLLTIPSTLLFENSFAEEVCLIDPGKSTKLAVIIHDVAGKLEEIGEIVPSIKEIMNFHIYPSIRVFGDEVNEKIVMSNANPYVSDRARGC